METLFTIYFMLDTPSPCRFLGVADGLEGGGGGGGGGVVYPVGRNVLFLFFGFVIF